MQFLSDGRRRPCSSAEGGGGVSAVLDRVQEETV